MSAAKKITSLALTFIFLIIFGCDRADAQASLGAASPDNSAMLDIVATGKGLLIPRMGLAGRPSSPVAGLLIYQTDNTPGFYYYTGSAWVSLAAVTPGAHDSTNIEAVIVGPYVSGTPQIGPYYVTPYSSTVVLSSANTTPTAFTPATCYVVPKAVTFSKLILSARVVPTGGTTGGANTTTLTLYKNGVATSITVTIVVPVAVGSTAVVADAAHTVSVVPGDVISYRFTQSNQEPYIMYTASLQGY